MIPNNDEQYKEKFKIYSKKTNYFVNPSNDTDILLYDYNYDININSIKLLTNYAFLDINEKIFFENNSHNYLITNTQNSLFSTKVNKNILFKLNFHNCCNTLIWFCKLKYNKKIDIYNYLNENDYIISSNILLNNISLNKINDIKLFNLINPINNNNNVPNKGINLYSFSLNNNNIQPNGSLNMSVINDIYLKLDFDKYIDEDIDLLCFNKIYNILSIKNGICSLLFNN